MSEDFPTSLQSNPLMVPQARTVSSNIANAPTQAQLDDIKTVTRPQVEPYPEPPVDPENYDDESLATEVQFQKPDWEKHGVAVPFQHAPTGPLPAPAQEKADTRILPRYDLDSFQHDVPVDHSSSWAFVLILAIVSFTVFIIYFIFS